MEVCARRLTKKEGAALSLPVPPLPAPPRAPRSPAVPSGAPAPPRPPLWEATWTCRFGPLAKSRLQAASSSSRRVPSPSPPRSEPPGLGASLAGNQGLGRGWAIWKSDAPGSWKVPRERGSSAIRLARALREQSGGAGTVLAKWEGAGWRSASPGGGASESESNRAAERQESSPRAARAAWVRPRRCASPGHARWKVFKATKARPGTRELPFSDAELASLGS